MYLVTEFGITDLYNQPIRERVRRIIAIARPDFRQQLIQEALGAKLIRDCDVKGIIAWSVEGLYIWTKSATKMASR